MNNQTYVVKGKNFSGRSDYLKSLCDGSNAGIYIGEIPSNYISGVSPTVKAELDLFSLNTDPKVIDAVQELIDKLKFEKLFESNPYLLSGGEQVILTIIAGMLSQPKLLAIDTLIEQLSEEWKKPLFKLLQNTLKPEVFIADNREKEYGPDFKRIISEKTPGYGKEFKQPALVELNNKTIPYHITINNLSFGYNKERQILRDINLDLEPGEIYFLKGVNGAGKSTLAKILSGILKVKNGIVAFNGEPVNPYKKPGKVFGYSFQNPDEQLFSRTVYKEVIGDNRKIDADTLNEREKYLQAFGLDPLQQLHPGELPYVIRKRIALAATLANERPWYIIDEPTIGQDDSFVDFLVAFFNRLVKTGKGIVIISHSQSFIEKFKAKILYLSNGSLHN